jgi:hypothetical protein
VTHLRLALFLIGLFLAAGAWAAHAESGVASVYGGRDTASGERENSGARTEAGKKESRDRRLNQACQLSVTPSSTPSLNYRRSDARTVEIGSAQTRSMNNLPK